MANNGSFYKWQWQKQHVNGNMLDGRHIVPDSSIIVAGPALLSQFADGDALIPNDTSRGQGLLHPIGSIMSFSTAQMRSNAPLFEVGAKRAYIVPGKVGYSCDLQGFTLYGPSLLRKLYALQPNPSFGGSGGTEVGMNPVVDTVGYGKWFPKQYKLNPGNGLRDEDDKNKDFYIAIASELFNVPIGLGMIFRNSQSGGYGGFYMEECMIDTHGMGIQSSESVIIETVRITYSLLVPMNVSSIS